LCLDEFAVTNVADAAIFTELLRLLAERQTAVVCTTNRPPEDLYKDGLHRDRYLPQLEKQIRDSYIIVPIKGTDYREALLEADEQRSANNKIGGVQGGGELGKSTTVFFEGGEAQAALNTVLLADASGEGQGKSSPSFAPGSVKVSWGRKLAVPAVAGGVASFAFDDLCRVALSAEDYMHLALQFHTIFVHGIPRLRLEEHNEARRFTNLIDALYEHSVRMVCHSIVPLTDVLKSVEALREASEDDDHDAQNLGVFSKMYDDTPNFQLQIKELGREKYNELKLKQLAEEELRYEAQRLSRQAVPDAIEGDVGSGWSAAPASADLSAPQAGVAGVMVAAVGSLQESGFAAARALSRLKEMQTTAYLEVAAQRREEFKWKRNL
jgi:predicted ATPase